MIRGCWTVCVVEGNIYSSLFFVQLYLFKCFDCVSAVSHTFSISRPCSQCKDFCSKLASFIVILVGNDMNTQKGHSQKGLKHI